MRQQAEQQQIMAHRKQQMQYQAWQEEQARTQAAAQLQARQGMGQALSSMYPAPPPVQQAAPAPGQNSAQPPSPPSQAPTASPGGPPPPGMGGVPPYRTVANTQAPPQGQPQGQAPQGGPPPVQPQQPQGGLLERFIGAMRKAGVPPEQWADQLDAAAPAIKMQLNDEMAQVKIQNTQFSQDIKRLQEDLKERQLTALTDYRATTTKQADTRLEQGQERIDKKGGRSGAGSGSGGANIGTPSAPSETVQNLAADLIAGRKKGDILVSRGKVSAAEFDAARNLAMKQLMDGGMDRVSASNALATGASNRVALDMTLRDRIKNKTAVDQYARQVEDQMKLVDDTLASSGLNTPKILNTKINALRSSMSSEQLAALRPVIAGLAREVQKLTTAPTSNAQLHVTATGIYDKIINEDMSIAEARAAMKSLQKEIVISRDQADKTVDVLQNNLKHVDARGDKPAAGGAGPYSDADKEARYQKWKAEHAGQ